MLGDGLDSIFIAAPVVVGRTGKVLWDLDRCAVYAHGMGKHSFC